MPTAGISLVRKHTEQMQLPRFLWVPFELGRPFGAPNEPDFQRRVLRSVLELLERDDGPGIIEDFPDDAPAYASGEGESWACPITFRPTEDERPELVAATLAEMERLAPWHELYVERRGGSAPTASGLELREVVRLLGKLAVGEQNPEVPTEFALHEWIRLGCDDLCTWYSECARGQPGRGSAAELRDWFWRDTAAARLIAAAATALLAHPKPIVKALALRVMIPRKYFPDLMPGTDPYI